MMLNKFLGAFILLISMASIAHANPCDVGEVLASSSSGMGGTGHANDSGIGGTGHDNGSGIGGTGHGNGSGIGGTGQQAKSGIGGTGIVGVITGFGSICVNGLEVFYDPDTPTSINGMKAGISNLNVGQLVVLDANTEDGALKASKIDVMPLLVGRVNSQNINYQEFSVMGLNIKTDKQTLGLENVVTGNKVSVYGFYKGNSEYKVLRIEAAPSTAVDTVAGLLNASGEVSGVKLNQIDRNNVNQQVRVLGVWNEQQFEVKKIEANPIATVIKAGKSIEIQGYADKQSAKSEFIVQGQVVQTDANTEFSGVNYADNQLVIVKGDVVGEGRIKANKIEFVKENAVLERGGSQYPVELKHANKGSVSGISKQDVAGKKSEGRHSVEHKKDNDNQEHANDRFENNSADGKPERPERAGQEEKNERNERLEKAERPERAEKPERPERPERPDRPEKVERPEKFEKPERIERED